MRFGKLFAANNLKSFPFWKTYLVFPYAPSVHITSEAES